MDVAGAGCGLIVIAPLLLAIAAYIKLVSPGPVFFRQKRTGFRGAEFTIWKFRTMKTDADTAIHESYAPSLIASDALLTKLDAYTDPRIIPFGGIFRQTGLDELPQLLNVLQGDMSLVGPRPDPVYSSREYRPWHRARLDVLPGMTGLWQVSGKNRTTFSQMVRLDIRYSRRRSFWLDTWILLLTPSAMLAQLTDFLRRGKAAAPQPAAGTPPTEPQDVPPRPPPILSPLPDREKWAAGRDHRTASGRSIPPPAPPFEPMPTGSRHKLKFRQ